jgi:hypothetical protein
MAVANDVASMANRQGVPTLPAPIFVLPPLPAKLARIDPDGAKKWHGDANAAIVEWVNKLTTVNSGIVAQIKT